MKPRIFIGSSSEGLKIAEYVGLELSDKFECTLWNDGIFQYNGSFLQALLKASGLFDFGIFIATNDDYTSSRGDTFETPRDNIIFEFGLFLGRLGLSKAFLIQEEGSKLPSDLLGISLPRFKRGSNFKKSVTLNSSINKLRETISSKVNLGELGLLPSTASAIGYYYNFVELICNKLSENTELIVDGKKFKKFEVYIVLPNDLDGDIKQRASIFSARNKLSQLQLDCSGRSFPIFASYSDDSSDVLSIYDMPTTLSSIDKCIELYMRKGFIGKPIEQTLLEQRELWNFESTLRNLVNTSSFSKRLVNFIPEEPK